MGAASTFGRSELGINSPTHRNTHAEEDLFGVADDISVPTTTAASKNDLLDDDIFKTCASTGDAPTSITDIEGDDFFNPRGEENHEFGDFASAFGATAIPVEAPQPIPTLSQSTVASTKKDEFADFSSAFTSAPLPVTVASGNDADMLFGSVAPLSNPIASNSISSSSSGVGGGADLLSDLDGLSLGAPIPCGEYSFHSHCDNNDL